MRSPPVAPEAPSPRSLRAARYGRGDNAGARCKPEHGVRWVGLLRGPFCFPRWGKREIDMCGAARGVYAGRFTYAFQGAFSAWHPFSFPLWGKAGMGASAGPIRSLSSTTAPAPICRAKGVTTI